MSDSGVYSIFSRQASLTRDAFLIITLPSTGVKMRRKSGAIQSYAKLLSHPPVLENYL